MSKTEKFTDDLPGLVLDPVESYNGKSKLVAQCYDAAARKAPGLNRLQARVKDVHPQALFVHCFAHTLNLVMLQGASKIKECKILFCKSRWTICIFYFSSKRTKLLDEICQRHLPHISKVRWNFHSRLVCTVDDKRAELIKVFSAHPWSLWSCDHETVHCASGHLAHWKSFNFSFLFSFIGIFNITDVLFGVLQNKRRTVYDCHNNRNVERERAKFSDIFD